MTDTAILDDLRAMRALFSGPEKWTQGTNARDVDRRKTDAESPQAVSWCFLGAIIKTNKEPSAGIYIINLLRNRVGNISNWNDASERKFEDVIVLLDELIEEARYDP